MRFFKVLIVFGFVFSCYPSDEEMERQVNSRFEGNWIGSYDGNDRGNITFKITNEGNFTGNLESTQLSNSEEFSGYVQSDGKLNGSTRSGYVFNGQLANFENSNGIWTKQSGNETLKGNFKVQKII